MKKHRLNWVDVLVILVAVLLIAGTCVKFLVLDPTETQQSTVEIRYTMRVSGVRQYTVDALQVGDILYEEAGKGQVGVISDIRVETAESLSGYPDATMHTVTAEDRYDVYLTVTAQSIPDGAFYKVGTYTIKRNQSTSYFTKYVAFGARVQTLEAVS